VTLRNAFVSGGPALKWYEVLLDNEADVSILDRRLLNNVFRESREPFAASGIVSGQSATLPLIGDLTNFFECYTSDGSFAANVFCQADVEDMYLPHHL
jgi:hypothetical protein